MKISVITVCYNAESTIRESIESVLSQDHSNLEFIIVDGASSDRTLEIVNTYKESISKIISEPDKGIYDAMNKGLALATGDLIAFLNADDCYAHNGVLSEVASLLTVSSSDTCYGDLQYVDFNDNSRVIRNWKSGPYKASAFKWGWMPPHPSFFARKSLYERYGGFRTELRTSADYELMLRFLYKEGASAIYLPEVLVLMKTGGQSNESLKSRIGANREDRKAWSLNGIKPFPFTTILKPLRKLGQFLPF